MTTHINQFAISPTKEQFPLPEAVEAQKINSTLQTCNNFIINYENNSYIPFCCFFCKVGPIITGVVLNFLVGVLLSLYIWAIIVYFKVIF